MFEFWNKGILEPGKVAWRDWRTKPNIIEVDLDHHQREGRWSC
jgi:hypothetical protein